MTYTTTLSARIAALEAQAAPLNELNAELAQLLERCNVVSCQIQDAVQAQHHLSELEGHAARLFGEPVNAESNSEPIRADAPQSETPAAQSEVGELPTSTGNTLMEAQPEPSTNAESNSEDGEPRSAMDVLIDWAKELTGTATTQEAADQTGVSWGTTKNYLPAMVKSGLLERVPGTGLPGSPAHYRRATTAQPQAPAPRAKPLTEAHLPRDLPPMVEYLHKATEGQMQAVQIALSQHGRPMSKSLLLSRVGMKAVTLDAALRQLAEAGKITLDDGRYTLADRQGAA